MRRLSGCGIEVRDSSHGLLLSFSLNIFLYVRKVHDIFGIVWQNTTHVRIRLGLTTSQVHNTNKGYESDGIQLHCFIEFFFYWVSVAARKREGIVQTEFQSYSYAERGKSIK